MNELIKVTERDGKQLVSARDLYRKLELADGQFARWARTNIVENPYAIENEDWVGFDIYVEGNSTKDYALVLSFAKKIAMMSKTEEGNKIRDYFLECERRAKKSATKNLPQTYIEALEALLESEKQKQQLQIEAKEVNDHIQRLTHDNKTYTTSEIAKELNLKSANQLNKLLEKKGIQYKLNGTWLLYSNYADKDYVSIKQQTLDNGKIIYDRRWNGKGRDFILELLKDR